MNNEALEDLNNNNNYLAVPQLNSGHIENLDVSYMILIKNPNNEIVLGR